MNKKTIIIIVFTLIIIVVLYSSMKKNSTANTEEEKAKKWEEQNSAANRYDDNSVSNAEKDQTKQTIAQKDLNKLIPEFWDIFRAGTTDGDRRRVVQIFNDYFFSKKDVLVLIDQYDYYAKNKKNSSYTFLHDYFLAMARNSKKEWNEKVNNVLANNGVKYQFVNE